jgi:hypothetical protein
MPLEAAAQIFLNPAQQQMSRSRVSIDMGDGIRCTSEGGAVPTLGLSVGAYPDQWGNETVVFSNGNIGNQSSLLGLLSVNIPLQGTSQKFDCRALLQDAQVKARLANLRELLDENLLTEAQYREAVLRLYGPLLHSTPPTMSQEATPPGSNSLRLEDPPLKPVPPASSPAARIPIASAGTIGQLPPPPPLPPLPSLPSPRAPQPVFVAKE